MRAKEIRVPIRYSGGRVGQKLRPQRRIKSESISFAWSGVYAHRALQLRNCDAIQDDAAVSQIETAWSIAKRGRSWTICRAESANQLRRQARLIRYDGSNVPASHDLVDDSSAVGHSLALAEWQVIRAIGMEGMPDVEECWPVAHPQVAHGEQPEGPRPRVSRLNAQSMAPGIVHVELHAVPRSLTPIHLKGVIVAKAGIRQVASRLAGIVRVGLEEVNRVAVPWIRYSVQGARRKIRTSDQVTEISRRPCQVACEVPRTAVL